MEEEKYGFTKIKVYNQKKSDNHFIEILNLNYFRKEFPQNGQMVMQRMIAEIINLSYA